jgi:hypothetical protein
MEEKLDRIRRSARQYYARKDIQEALVKQARNREFVPRYGEGFGKRPDTVEYAGDILSYVEKGATSFHVSEEIWSNPMEIGTNLRSDQLAKIREGWDLILDIDCKFLEYSKIAAFLLCEAMFFHGVRNFGLKFSGGSGFHVGLSYDAFPKLVNNVEIKNFFPEGPRIIASYLKNMIENPLREHILDMSDPKDIALSMGKPVDLMYKTDSEGRKIFNPFSVLEIDTILISSRHLYRAAYSINEKTGFVSIVIKPEHLKQFHPSWAKPERVLPQQFLKQVEKNEAKELFIQALDWNSRQQAAMIRKEQEVKQRTQIREVIKITKFSDEIYPPCIKKILEGMKHDGRKRALFVLLGYFRNIGMEAADIETKLLEWNKKNYQPLRENYIKTQVNWFKRQEKRLPPNCALQAYYQDMEACMPDALCRKIKNPVNYTMAKARSLQNPKSKFKKRKEE